MKTMKELEIECIVEDAQKALKAAHVSGDDYGGVCYLLANLMMYCHKKDINFEEALGRARYHFDCEK